MLRFMELTAFSTAGRLDMFVVVFYVLSPGVLLDLQY